MEHHASAGSFLSGCSSKPDQRGQSWKGLTSAEATNLPRAGSRRDENPTSHLLPPQQLTDQRKKREKHRSWRLRAVWGRWAWCSGEGLPPRAALRDSSQALLSAESVLLLWWWQHFTMWRLGTEGVDVSRRFRVISMVIWHCGVPGVGRVRARVNRMC